jgi:protein gp37
MADKSFIEWTNSTWNVVTGCDKVSSGCKNCYAERYAKRLQNMGVEKYRDGFELRLHPEVMTYPLGLKQPKMIFVNSMSDLFHEKIPFEFTRQVFDIMEKAHWHHFQILTKRGVRLTEFSKYYGEFPTNVWIGVSVETPQYKSRIDDLRNVNAKIHFLSLEPLLEPLGELNLDDIEWVIAGGESGPSFRDCKAEWIRAIRDQCIESDVPFFFKQWGGFTSKAKGRTLDGKIWNQFPALTSEEGINTSLLSSQYA